MKKRLAICDADARYRQSMQTYLMKKMEEFEVLSFGSLPEAAEYSRKQIFAILLIGENTYEKDLQNVQALQIFILRESGEKAITEYPYLEKYQSMETLIRDIWDGYAEHSLMDSPMYRSHKTTKIHAFYSPAASREQTMSALALGQILAERDKRVLYLNLQAFAWWEESVSEIHAADITDLLYVIGRQDGNLVYRIQGMKQTFHGVDYFSPAEDYMDLLKISEAEWVTFLDRLIEIGEYSDIILDLSEICQGLYRILQKSDCVYSMCGRTKPEKQAVYRYKKLLEKRELSSILEKTKWLELPWEVMERVTKIERLSVTPLGEYMKGLV